MADALTKDMRVYEPYPGLLAFYDGRVAGKRFAPGPNWVDDGALSLGIASYALFSGEDALIYDTHVSVEHGRAILAILQARGVRRWRVVLSHWHLDHVAGTTVFGDAEIIANRRTFAHMTRHRSAIEDGSLHGAPAICPLVLPGTLYSGEMHLTIGDRHVTLIEANIHSDDATVVWLPQERVLLAGDTVEDCVTYVVEPEGFAQHLIDLDRLAALNPLAILPCHGAPDVIAAGGYDPGFIAATQGYIRWLQRLQDEPDLAGTSMADVINPWLKPGVLHFFSAYDAVHRHNIAACLAMGKTQTRA